MTQLRRDAAYIRLQASERTSAATSGPLTGFDEEVYDLLDSAHTVVSAAKTISDSGNSSELEDRVADSMQRLLQAERIQLSPDA